MDSKIPVKLRLGVLAPGSNFVPFLAGDMLSAFESGLKEARFDAELVIESAGYNADSKMLIPAIQQLILARRVNCIIAPLNVSLIGKISGYCESQNIPLIALNLTEDPLYEASRNPFVFVNSFHLWHSAWMSGYLAGRRFGSRGAAIVPIHEAGYGLMFAFQLGLEAAQGGLTKVAVTHRNSSSEDPTEHINEITAQPPDFIWAAYSGKEAASFLTAFEAAGFKDKIPLMTISPTVSQNVRQLSGSLMNGIWYVASENYDADVSANSLVKISGRQPNPYGTLAYEAARLIAAAVRNMDNSKDFAEVFPEALRQAEFKSFRGKVRFNDDSDAETFYLRQITNGKDTIEKIAAPPLLKEQYRLACKKLVKEGWVNPYLCA